MINQSNKETINVTKEREADVAIKTNDSNYEKKNLDDVPIIKFGPSNNLMKFKEALSKKVLEEYGVLGKLIKKGKIKEIEETDG
jgi:hypothetical protein